MFNSHDGDVGPAVVYLLDIQKLATAGDVIPCHDISGELFKCFLLSVEGNTNWKHCHVLLLYTQLRNYYRYVQFESSVRHMKVITFLYFRFFLIIVLQEL